MAVLGQFIRMVSLICYASESVDTSGLQQRLWESHISLERLTFRPIGEYCLIPFGR